MEKNVALLRKTKEALLANPTKHRQSSWIDFDYEWSEEVPTSNMCHTTMCSAGHAAALAGADIPTLGEFWNSGWRLTEDGKLAGENEGLHVSEWAQQELGMNWREADYIFMCMVKDTLFQRIDQLIELWENGEEMTADTYRIPED